MTYESEKFIAINNTINEIIFILCYFERKFYGNTTIFNNLKLIMYNIC